MEASAHNRRDILSLQDNSTKVDALDKEVQELKAGDLSVVQQQLAGWEEKRDKLEKSFEDSSRKYSGRFVQLESKVIGRRLIRNIVHACVNTHIWNAWFTYYVKTYVYTFCKYLSNN